MKLLYTFSLIALGTYLLAACDSGDSKTSNQSPKQQNVSPTINVQSNIKIPEQTSAIVLIDVNDEDGPTPSIEWIQMDGPSLDIQLEGDGYATILVPEVSASSETSNIMFTVTDEYRATASSILTVEIINSNRPPVADAGDDASTISQNGVVLSGHRSYDPDGDYLSYEWILITPGLSSTELSDANTVTSHFIPDFPGEYIATLTVRDAEGSSDSDSTVISVESENMQPISNAGPDQSIETGTEVGLSGIDSYDPDGAALLYSWRLLPPDSSTAIIQNPLSRDVSFFADVDGLYEAYLTVDDGELKSVEDKIVIIATSTNSPPVSVAGPHQSASLGVVVDLDGSASFDPNADAISYQWRIISQPNFSDVAITGNNTSQPSFTPSKVGNYLISLTVNDGEFSDESSLIVSVTEGDIYIDITDNPNARYAWPFSGSYSFGTQTFDDKRFELTPTAIVAVGADFTINVSVIDKNNIVTGGCGDLVNGQVIEDGETVPSTCFINKAKGGEIDVEFKIEVEGYKNHSWTYRVKGEFL